MKYVRFISKENKTCQGIVEANGSIQLIQGDILGEHKPTGQTCPAENIKQYLPPIDPPNIIALGLNYSEHIREFGHDTPTAPVIFIKATTSLTAHQCPIILPKEAPAEVDYEAELVVVIGKRAKNVTPQNAPQYIFGYTCGNDVTARDCQQRLDKQWARAKSFDSFAPVGPIIETELDTTNLRIRSILNGQTLQDSSTADLIFSVAKIISYLSNNMTLLPGTIIFTGTPPGVGFAKKLPVFLNPGDTISVEIEGVGSLQNHVIAEV